MMAVSTQVIAVAAVVAVINYISITQLVDLRKSCILIGYEFFFGKIYFTAHRFKICKKKKKTSRSMKHTLGLSFGNKFTYNKTRS